MRLLPVLLLLSACADPDAARSVGDEPGTTALLPDDALAPPLTLTVSPILPGQVATWTATGANPGDRVWFLVGPATGTLCPSVLAGACLGITGPRVLGSDVADAAGVATFTRSIPPALPVGLVGYFQAGVLPPPAAYLSPVVQRVVGGSGGGPSGFLIVDAFANNVIQIDATGSFVDSWPSPVSDLRGVAWDTRAGDGFWVAGNGNLNAAYKVSAATGATLSTMNLGGYPRQEIRGLDYWENSTGDLLAMVSWNVNQIEVIYGFEVATGSRYIETSHYLGGFLSGYWGVAVTAQPSDFERWSTWSSGDVEHWLGSGSGAVVDLHVGGAGLRGVDTDASGDLYIVDAQLDVIHHLQADGTPVGTISLPIPDAGDISVIP